MRINHNLNAMNALRNMTTNTNRAGKSMEKLSSGLRINRAGDDAAGLAISEKMRGQIRGLDQAGRNAQDGISMIQTAEGALNETQSILQRMRELATQSANDTNTDKDREQVQNEINQLTSEINRIGNTTEFNTQKLLDGTKNRTEATAGNLTGTAVDGNVKIVASTTNPTATGAKVGSVEIHDGKSATATSGKEFAAGTTKNIAVSASNNELTVTYKSGSTITQKTITLAVTAYNRDTLATEINSKLDGATGFNADKLDVSFDADGHLQISTKAKGADEAVTIDGGNALEHLATAGSVISTSGGVDANNTLRIVAGGDAATITLDSSNYKDASELVSAIAQKIQASAVSQAVTVSADDGKLVFSSTDTDKVTIEGGSSENILGLSNEVLDDGIKVNNVIEMKIDGAAITVTMNSGEYSANDLAGLLESKINAETAASIADVSVSVQDGKLFIESGSQGDDSEIIVTDSEAAKAIGLSTDSVKVDGTAGTNSNVTLQIGANKGQAFQISVSDMRAEALGVAGTAEGTADGVADTAAGATFSAAGKGDVTNGTDSNVENQALDVSTHEKATAAVDAIDQAINSVSTERAKLGSFQNRLEHTINNLGTASENLTAAESRIRDVDMAKEMMSFSKDNILQQAAQAMLAQAKQQPQGVLQLLR